VILGSIGVFLSVPNNYYFVSCAIVVPGYKENSRYANTVTKSFPLEWVRKTQHLLDARSETKGSPHMVVRLLSYSEITYDQYLQHQQWTKDRQYDDQG
jgi:hypothetical protein